MVHSTFVIERIYEKPVARMFQAFADPVFKRRWFAGGRIMFARGSRWIFEFGGRERNELRFMEGSLFPGVTLTADGFVLEIVSERRIVSASAMTVGDWQISAALVTVELEEVAGDCGDGDRSTVFGHAAGSAELEKWVRARRTVWQKELDRLGRLWGEEGQLSGSGHITDWVHVYLIEKERKHWYFPVGFRRER